MADFPATSSNTAIAALLPSASTFYLSLHTADPGTTGASEVTGGSYARQAIQFNAPSNGTATSSTAQSFTAMPAESGNLWIGIWSAASGGTFLWGASAAAVTGPVAAGATVNFAIGAVTAGPIS